MLVRHEDIGCDMPTHESFAEAPGGIDHHLRDLDIPALAVLHMQNEQGDAVGDRPIGLTERQPNMKVRSVRCIVSVVGVGSVTQRGSLETIGSYPG